MPVHKPPHVPRGLPKEQQQMMFGFSVSPHNRNWPARSATTTLFILTLVLSGCGGNYKVSDGDYRPLGEPEVTARSQ